MAGKVRYLPYRDGRYFARMVIPKELRPFMDGRTELRTPLCPDYRTALKKLPGAVALLQHEIAIAERKAVEDGERKVTIGGYPLAMDQLTSSRTVATDRCSGAGLTGSRCASPAMRGPRNRKSDLQKRKSDIWN